MNILRGIIRNFKEALVFGPLYVLRHTPFLRIRNAYIPTRVGRIFLRNDQPSDASSFYHIFVRKVYSLDGFAHSVAINRFYERLLQLKQTPIIIDAGANVGAASVWFSRRYPKATILSVEPDPDNAAAVRRNTRRLNNVAVLEAAVGGVSGKILTVPDSSGRSDRIQSKREVASTNQHYVEALTIDSILSKAGPGAELFILKVDIEGFESDLFASNLEWLSKVAVIMIEPHDWMFPWRGTSTHFLKAVAENKFEVLISEDTLFCINPDLRKLSGRE